MNIRIDCTEKELEIGKPLFYGKNPYGEEIEVNSKYITRGGRPWYPVSGEFHFSRYDNRDWEREILKMRDAGITLLATYLIWIHHEEVKGNFNFTGDRNLKLFLELCSKHKVSVLLRIGPWSHGEVRNGGFPDWLLKECKAVVRTPDPQYLSYVDRYFKEVGRQCEGAFYKDGGCIVGIQIDNECWTTVENERQKLDYMRKVKKILVKHGFIVPFYTATAWGRGAVVDGEMLPVMGGYADAPWDKSTKELPPSSNFLMSRALNDESIGSDLKTDGGKQPFTCDVNKYPYLTCEIGGGVQCTKHRRPLLEPLDTLALAVCKLGSGVNLLGFYMYHGGTNPDGELSTLQESKATGYPNDLPIKSYDFQAPISESGRPRESYFLLKPLFMMLKEWGDFIAKSKVILPSENATDPADMDSLRIAIRYNSEERGGLVFINNHLRKHKLKDHYNVDLWIDHVQFPTFDVLNDEIKLLPFHFPLGKSILKCSNATPLTRIGERFFFYTDQKPYYEFYGNERAEIITLSNWDASRAAKFHNVLYIADSIIYEKDNQIIFETEANEIKVKEYRETGGAREFILSCEQCFGQAELMKGGEESSIELTYNGCCEDYLLQIAFAGDRIQVYQEERLIADWFHTGLPLQISLKKYEYPKHLTVKCFEQEEETYYDIAPELGAYVKEVKVIPVYSLRIDEI